MKFSAKLGCWPDTFSVLHSKMVAWDDVQQGPLVSILKYEGQVLLTLVTNYWFKVSHYTYPQQSIDTASNC